MSRMELGEPDLLRITNSNKTPPDTGSWICIKGFTMSKEK